MKRFALSGAGLAAVALAGASTTASADMTIEIDNTFAGGSFSFFSVSGSLSSITISGVMTSSGASWTWANDLAVIALDASSSVAVQFGGYSNWGAYHATGSYSGSSSSAGTSIGGSMSMSPIAVSTIAIGNGYGSGGPTSWVATITLGGVNAVPAPGALALLGVAGIAGRRRRA